MGHHYVDSDLDELVFFIRKDKAIPFGKAAASTAEIDPEALSLIGYRNCHYELYSDNGISPNPNDSLLIKKL